MFAMLLSICLLQPTAASGSWENEFQRYQASGGVTEPKYTSADLTNATMTATPRPSFDPNLARKPTAASGSWENKFQLYQPSNKIPYWKNPSIFQEEPKYTSADLPMNGPQPAGVTMTATPRPSFDPNLPSGFENATTANGLSFNPNCQQNNRLTSGSSESRDPTPGSQCETCNDTGLEPCDDKKDCTNEDFFHVHAFQQCTRPCRCGFNSYWTPSRGGNSRDSPDRHHLPSYSPRGEGFQTEVPMYYTVDEESRGRCLSKGTLPPFADLVKQIDEQGC